MTSVGYNGYVANNPQPNLLECNNNIISLDNISSSIQ